MTTAPILPFRLRRRTSQYAWTGASIIATEIKHGLVRLDGDRIVIQTTCSRKVVKMCAMGSVNTAYENLPAEERTIDLSEINAVMLRVPTWDFWTAPRVVFMVREMKVVEGLPSAGPAEFSVPVAHRDRGTANAFVVACDHALRAISTASQELPSGAPVLEA